MFSTLFLRLRAISRKIWVRTLLISGLAILAALSSPFVQYVVPVEIALEVDKDTLRSLLDILANSMLAVTTFSLTIMVTTQLHVSSLASPRAHRILSDDARTQTVMATFVGSFVYSLCGIVMIQLELIGEDSFAALYLMTLGIIILIIVTILRWIAHLTRLGSMEDTAYRVEGETRGALNALLDRPFLGARKLTGDEDWLDDTTALESNVEGFLQRVDTRAIGKVLPDGAKASLPVRPGAWVAKGDSLLCLCGADLTDDLAEKLHKAIDVGDVRVFDQDVAFGVRVMAEIAERALSPGVNDPRTATDVIARLTGLLGDVVDEEEDDEPEVPNMYVPSLDYEEVVSMALNAIARDGQGYIEVQMALQKTLARLADHPVSGISDGAHRLSARALAYAADGLLLKEDYESLCKVAVASEPAELLQPDTRPAENMGKDDT